MWLCCRYHAELNHLQPLRAAAAESAALRERLREAFAAAAALAASRQELKSALDDAHAGLAAATERCRQLEGLDQSRQLLCSKVRGLAVAVYATQAVGIMRLKQGKASMNLPSSFESLGGKLHKTCTFFGGFVLLNCIKPVSSCFLCCPVTALTRRPMLLHMKRV